jgi:hypothetical protein
MLNGYELNGHPVRQVHELLNVPQRGYIPLENNIRARIWASEAFSVVDLVAYLDGSTTHRDYESALLAVDLTCVA